MNDNINLNRNKKTIKNDIFFQMITKIDGLNSVEKMKELSNNRLGILLEPQVNLDFYPFNWGIEMRHLSPQVLLIYSLNTFKEIYKINSDNEIFDIIELKNNDLIIDSFKGIYIYKLSKKKYELFQKINEKCISLYGLINSNLILINSEGLNIYHKKDLYILKEHLKNTYEHYSKTIKIIEINKNKLIILNYYEYQDLNKRIGNFERIYLILYYNIENKIKKQIRKYHNSTDEVDILIKNEYLLIKDDDYLTFYNILNIEDKNDINDIKTDKIHIKYFPNIYNYLYDFILIKYYKEIELYKLVNKSLEFYRNYQFDFLKEKIGLKNSKYFSIILKNNNIVIYYSNQIYVIKHLIY